MKLVRHPYARSQ